MKGDFLRVIAATNWDIGSVILLQLDTIGHIPIGFFLNIILMCVYV